MTVDVQWSELQRDPKGVAELVDAHGGVRVRRRDGVGLVLTREDRATAIAVGSFTAARALRNALAHLPPDRATDVLREEFPWVDLLPPADATTFVIDFSRAVQACAELENWSALARTITEWKATAAVHADPELRASLTAPIDDDLGPVPHPTAH